MKSIRTASVILLLVAGGCSGQSGASSRQTSAQPAEAAPLAENQPSADQPESQQSAAGDSAQPQQIAELLPDGPTEADYPHLHNLLQVSGRIYSGGEPKDEVAFAELAKLGVKTVVSVDGAKPKLELAQKHGLRYVHIPIGYDGVTGDAGRSFASLVKNAEGPFYIHCHHGKHRGPAAAAIACIADGDADGKSALTILEKAETSKGYGGLWRDVVSFARPAADAELPELVEVAEVGSLASAMAQIDRANDNLKLCEAEQWRTPADHPDVAPPQEALLLKEGFRETVRQLTEANDYDGQFLTWMQEAEQAAAELETALQAGDMAAAGATFAKVQNQCKQCHGKYRN